MVQLKMGVDCGGSKPFPVITFLPLKAAACPPLQESTETFIRCPKGKKEKHLGSPKPADASIESCMILKDRRNFLLPRSPAA